MLRAICIAIIAFQFASNAASACLQTQSQVRTRELTLLDEGLAKFRLAPHKRAEVATLRTEAETLYSAKRFGEAIGVRHKALNAVGYAPVAHDGPVPKSAAPRSLHPRGPVAAPYGYVTCGSVVQWLAPAP